MQKHRKLSAPAASVLAMSGGGAALVTSAASADGRGSAAATQLVPAGAESVPAQAIGATDATGEGTELPTAETLPPGATVTEAGPDSITIELAEEPPAGFSVPAPTAPAAE